MLERLGDAFLNAFGKLASSCANQTNCVQLGLFVIEKPPLFSALGELGGAEREEGEC